MITLLFFHLYFFLSAFVLHTLKRMANTCSVKIAAKATNDTFWPKKGRGKHSAYSEY